MLYPSACVIIFAREPVPGKTKTRLIPVLGEEGACALYTRLLHRQLDIFKAEPICHTELWIDGNTSHYAFSSFDGDIFQQISGDLGQRMEHAMTNALEKYPLVLIIGTDCPEINKEYLESAIKSLESTADVTIGPATDGGYVLLGLSNMVQDLFSGIEWGSDKVLAQTRAVLKSRNITWFELPELYDIDRPEDLLKLD